jgi:hypothetical protein
MKGLVSLTSVLALGVIIILFGGAVYDIMTTSVRCGFSLAGDSTYTCDEFQKTIGLTLVYPDRNIVKGVESIQALEDFRQNDPETYDQLQSVVSAKESDFLNLILVGMIGNVVLIVVMIMVWMKMSPSSKIDSGSLFVSILAGILLYCLIYVAFTTFIEHDPKVPGAGMYMLIKNPDILFKVIDRTSILPGTLEMGDITNGTNTVHTDVPDIDPSLILQ